VQRRLAAPPAGEAVVLRADAWGVRRELETAGALRRRREGSKLVILRQDDRLVGGRAQKVGEAGVGGVAVEHDGEVVDPLDPARRRGALERGEGLGAGVLADETRERRDDVV